MDADEQLRHDGDRIEALLEELQATAGPPTWLRVEELVQRLVTLYGAGFSRMLDHARAAGAPDDALAGRLADDELLSGLLLLHGLHPATAEERIVRALAQVRPYLGSHAGDIELVALENDGAVRLRLLGSCSSCPSSRATVEHTIRRAVEDSAPEVTRIEVEGVDPPATGSATSLVQIDLLRSRDRAKPRWTAVGNFESPGEGQYRVAEVSGVRLLLLNLAGALLAYRCRCTGCDADLNGARLDRDMLTCGKCGRRYDVARGGRAQVPDGPHLEPVPCLVDANGPRVALPSVSP